MAIPVPLLLTCSLLSGATQLREQSLGSLSGSMSGGGLKAEAFVGQPLATASSAGTLRESISFPAVAGAPVSRRRIPCQLQLDREEIQPGEQFTARCLLDLRETGFRLGGYACVVSWDTTLVAYRGYTPPAIGRFTSPQVNDNLVAGGQLVLSEVVAEGDTGLIELLRISFGSRTREDSARCVLDLKLLSLTTARTFQSLSGLADVIPSGLVIRTVVLDTIPPVIREIESCDYTYDPRGPYQVRARVEDPILSQVRLAYRRQGSASYTTVTMAADGERFTGAIPGQPVGTTVEFYIEAADTMGNLSHQPADYQSSPYSFQVILRQEPYTDCNGDGRENIVDVLSLLLMARRNPKDPRLDWDGDGRFTTADALLMLESLLGKGGSGGSLMLAGAGEADLMAELQASSEELEYLRTMIPRLGLPSSLLSQFEAALGVHRLVLPRAFTLQQNYPNPFNPSTVVAYTIPEGALVPVSLVVYDLRGRLVRRLVQGYREAGGYSVSWDGRDENGGQVPSGVYLYRIAAGGFVETRKMVLLK